MFSSKRTVVVTFQLTIVEKFVLAAILTAAQGLVASKAIGLDTPWHYSLMAGIMVLAALVAPLSPGQFLAKIPPQIIAIVQALLTVLVIAQQGWSLSTTVVTIIACVFTVAQSLGLGPAPLPATPHPSPVPPSPAAAHKGGSPRAK